MRRMLAMASAMVAAAVLATPAWADVQPHRLISDSMVLQQGAKVPVWGTSGATEKVTVKFQEQEQTATAKDGKWMVWFENLKPGGPFEMTISGDNTITIKDVLVGEVWIASGQSNMQWSVAQSADPEETAAKSANDMIRLLTVPRRAAAEPETDVDASWAKCGPETVRDFSAVAYAFGKDLQERLKVPVGLISTNYGGTVAEAWTSRETLDADPEFKGFLAQPVDPKNANSPTGLYNAMIHPLLPYGIRGAIWYQGESNASRAYQYQTLFPAMIADWRKSFNQGDFPFLFVQVAPFMDIQQEPMDSQWAELREAQRQTSLTIPNTAMAVITDLGDEKDIHPKQKGPVGQRLALAARALAYGEQVEYTGPVFDQSQASGDGITLSFEGVGSGLVPKDGELKGFTIAGADEKFFNAKAEIQGDTVVVSSPEVTSPIAVRYGWANYPLGNLWNQDGLPASPFRTDDFIFTTKPK